MDYDVIDFGDKKIIISKINGNQLLIDEEQYQNFLFSNQPLITENRLNEKIEFAAEYSRDIVKTVYICIHASSSCNLRCTYCFKNDRVYENIDFNTAKSFIDYIISLHPLASKYVVDLSGSGEPLLNLDLILPIGEYCKKKSDDLCKEVLPMLVTNGVYLDEQNVHSLRKSGILFGVSIDGTKRDHDVNRKDINLEGTHKKIINNVKKIKDRKLLGAAVTLNNSNINVLKTHKFLLRYFPTISIKPIRSTDFQKKINNCNVNLYKKEYTKLIKYITKKTLNYDLDSITALLNGDDYFGKYIFRVILNKKTNLRCDAGLGRYSLATNGIIFMCPASIDINQFEIGNIVSGVDLDKQNLIWGKLSSKEKCNSCIAKFVCGGECLISLSFLNPETGIGNNSMCEFNVHLFLLAVKFKHLILVKNEDIYNSIYSLCIEIDNRFKEDRDLSETLKSMNNEYTFTELKKLKDELPEQYFVIKSSKIT